MPIMDGMTSTSIIRNIEKVEGWIPIPIFAISATVKPEEQKACFDVGMNGFLSKPMRFEELTAKLQSIRKNNS